LPILNLPPLPPIPKGQMIPGFVVPAPSGFYVGMAVTNGSGALYGRIVKADDQASLLVQTMDGKQRAIPADKLKIVNAMAISDLSEPEFRKLAKAQ